MTRLARLAILRRTLPIALVSVTTTVCSREPLSSPDARQLTVNAAVAARAPAGPAVTNANPPFGDQGTTLDVHVIGSGFTNGAQATWLLHGTPDPHVKTNSTQFVSSTELVANVTIAPDAALTFWDVQVALVGGKNGVGADLFEVTSAQVVSAADNNSVSGPSDLLEVAGYSSTGAFVIDAASQFISLGSGQAWGIAPSGSTALGRDGTFFPVVWARQPDGTWQSQSLPSLPVSGGGNATSAAYASDGTLIVGGWDTSPSSKKTPANNRPVVWRRTGGLWSAPSLYVLPAGAQKAGIRTVNGLGNAAGNVDASGIGAVWDDPATVARLDGLPNAINSAGTLIVGNRPSGNSPQPVFWWRDPVTHSWHTTGTPFPTIAGANCTYGNAIGLNQANMVAGTSCNANGTNQATVWFLDLSGAAPTVTGLLPLPGLGGHGPVGSELSEAVGVSATAPYTAFGRAQPGAGPQYDIVRWLIVH
jgi:hypothetical protein